MSVITSIEEQKNKARVNIFVDGAFFCGLLKETALIFKLKVGEEVGEEKLKKAVFESEVKRAFEKAADYLGARMHSKKELFDKLTKKGFEKQVVDGAIKKLEDYGYVDDRLFAKQFVLQNQKDSRMVLEQKLKQKGVSKDVANMIFEDETKDDREAEICFAQAKKIARNKDLTDREVVKKLYASLLRKGFQFDLVKKCVSKIANTSDFDEFE